MTAVALPAVLDLSAAVLLAETLQNITGPVLLDGTAVERIGVSGLQVLLSAHVGLTAAGHELTIACPSEPLLAAARTAGAQFLFAS